jgi:hypothetical protein
MHVTSADGTDDTAIRTEGFINDTTADLAVTNRSPLDVIVSNVPSFFASNRFRHCE